MTRTRFEVRSADWLRWEDARARILEAASVGAVESRTPAEAVGLALAEDLQARATLPPWDNAAMDGYAVREADVRGASPAAPVELRVVDAVRAGDAPTAAVGPGEAVRIMTGAPVPAGADTVIRVEDTDAEEAEPGRIRVLRDRDVGRHVRPAGEDMELGAPVLPRGTTVRWGTVAVLASLGLDRVPVVRPPRVAILATGDELRTPEAFADVQAGLGVPESNGPMLAAALREAGAEVTAREVVPDDATALADAISRHADADVIVTIGGASMGEADLVKRVLAGFEYRQVFWRVRMRPGSPVGFGLLGAGHHTRAVFSLPGNPASAFVTFELLVRPYLRASGGHRQRLRRVVPAVAGETLRGPADLAVFLRVRLDAGVPPTARLAGPQGSGLVRSLGQADGLAMLPEGVEEVHEGQRVEVILLHTDAGGADPAVP